jgi:chlorite dismutase
VDGKWATASEWADATEQKVNSGNMTIYIRIKHDADYIYLLVDFPTDSVIEYAAGTAPPHRFCQMASVNSVSAGRIHEKL